MSLLPLTKKNNIQNILDRFPCTTTPDTKIFSMLYSVTCKVYTGYHGTSEIEYGLCACTVDNPCAKAQGLSLPIDTQTMLYLTYYLTITKLENYPVTQDISNKIRTPCLRRIPIFFEPNKHNPISFTNKVSTKGMSVCSLFSLDLNETFRLL